MSVCVLVGFVLAGSANLNAAGAAFFVESSHASLFDETHCHHKDKVFVKTVRGVPLQWTSDFSGMIAGKTHFTTYSQVAMCILNM